MNIEKKFSDFSKWPSSEMQDAAEKLAIAGLHRIANIAQPEDVEPEIVVGDWISEGDPDA